MHSDVHIVYTHPFVKVAAFPTAAVTMMWGWLSWLHCESIHNLNVCTKYVHLSTLFIMRYTITHQRQIPQQNRKDDLIRSSGKSLNICYFGTDFIDACKYIWKTTSKWYGLKLQVWKRCEHRSSQLTLRYFAQHIPQRIRSGHMLIN